MKIQLCDQRINFSEDSINTIFENLKYDSLLKEKFIRDYKPYILKTVSHLLGRYIDESNEEYSIGLLAFNEAIDFYDIKKNSNFFKYADMVIKHRIIDYIRINKKHLNSVPFSCFEDDEGFEERYLLYDSLNQYEKVEIKEEILLFEQQLKEFGISLEDLAASSPRHEDSRSLCKCVGGILARNDLLFQKMVKKKMLPLSDLMKLVKVHQRTIERNRKYIIAVALILRSNYDQIKEYFTNIDLDEAL